MRSPGAMLAASTSASGIMRTGPLIGRQTLYSAKRRASRAGAASRLDQPLDLLVVDRAHLALVVEIAHRRVMARQGEAVPVEIERLGDRSCIANPHAEAAVIADPPRHAGARRR